MRTLVTTVLFLLASNCVAGSTSIEQYQWKNRVLVFQSPQAAPSKWISQQKEKLLLDKPGLHERDLVLIDCAKSPCRVLEWQKDNTVTWKTGNPPVDKESATSVTLIGKDGGKKKVWTSAFPATELYKIIDAMPMRQQEMKKESNK